MGVAPRGQGQVIRVTPGPRLSFWSGLGRRRCRRGEEEDTVPGVADAWGSDGSGSWWGRRVRGREHVLGWLAGPGAAVRKLGWLAGRAGRAGYGASSFLFLFLFYFPSSLFEFKF